MKIISKVIIAAILAFFISCADDFNNFEPNSGTLTFSKDTIFLDTIFTNISSSTRTLKVYNKSNKNINIPTISLGRKNQSFYRLSVDGMTGKSFENVEILAKDSMYIFIEATIDYNQVTNPIYTDSIVFDSGANLQDVDLVTLVQDAHFLYPQKDAQGIKETIVLGTDADGKLIEVEGFYLENNQTWTNDKPYVIYGFVGVNSGNSLHIEEGVKVHFHQNSGLLIEKGGSLKVNGTLEKQVVFEGDRLEPGYANTPGQWSTIWFRAGSINNRVNYALIKNNEIGVLVDSIGNTNPTLQIANTQIYNTSSFGMIGRSTNIKGSNLVIGNNAQASLACTFGGTYNFSHITLANYWNSSVRQFPALLVNNFQIINDSKIVVRDLHQANFTNTIIYGSRNFEYLLEKEEGASFNYNFKNSLIRFNDTNGNFENNPLYDFEDVNHYQNNILNGAPHFKNVEKNEYIIGQNSEAINKADVNAAQQVPLDILKVNRLPNPDIGAYQHIILETP